MVVGITNMLAASQKRTPATSNVIVRGLRIGTLTFGFTGCAPVAIGMKFRCHRAVLCEPGLAINVRVANSGQRYSIATQRMEFSKKRCAGSRAACSPVDPPRGPVAPHR
jgi:hypothetical protein